MTIDNIPSQQSGLGALLRKKLGLACDAQLEPKENIYEVARVENGEAATDWQKMGSKEIGARIKAGEKWALKPAPYEFDGTRGALLTIDNRDAVRCGLVSSPPTGWKLEYLKSVELHNKTLNELREALAEQPAQQEPDETLLFFYQATDFPSLVAAMEGHIKKLQGKLQANPETAIDAWNAREMMRPATTQMHQGTAMTKPMDDLVQMAIDAGNDRLFDSMEREFLERFAQLVAKQAAEAEREACAKVCDEFERAKWESVAHISQNGGRLAFAGPMHCAKAIRARTRGEA